MKFRHVKLVKWRPPSLSELTPIISNMRLTHLGLEASNYVIISNKGSIKGYAKLYKLIELSLNKIFYVLK